MTKPAVHGICEKKRALAVGVAAACWLAALSAHAATYSYVDWTSASVASGTAAGTITLPDASTVTVDFQAINANATPGTLYGAQTNGGTNYWSPSTPYLGAQVENAPPTPDILQLSGGLDQTYKVTLSEPIKDPIMAIVSLGQPGVSCTYDFDAPFTIVSQDAGYWGGSTTALSALPGDILEGYEGHGTIQFIGTFSTFSWTVPTPETWHGFTFAIRTTERLEPTPDPGTGGAGGAGGGAGGADSPSDGNEPEGGDVANGGTPTGEAGSPTAGAPAGGQNASNGVGAAAAAAGRDSDSDSDGGASDEDRALSKDSAGCGCSLPGTTFGTSLSAITLLLSGLVVRRLRRARR